MERFSIPKGEEDGQTCGTAESKRDTPIAKLKHGSFIAHVLYSKNEL